MTCSILAVLFHDRFQGWLCRRLRCCFHVLRGFFDRPRSCLFHTVPDYPLMPNPLVMSRNKIVNKNLLYTIHVVKSQTHRLSKLNLLNIGGSGYINTCIHKTGITTLDEISLGVYHTGIVENHLTSVGFETTTSNE